MKTDYSAVNNITYGLLSVDAWKDHLVRIISQRIDDFQLTKEQEKIVKGQIKQFFMPLLTASRPRNVRRHREIISKRLGRRMIGFGQEGGLKGDAELSELLPQVTSDDIFLSSA
ncbi:MAG: hypothetical protein QM762_07765 [Chryseolinea sp.]